MRWPSRTILLAHLGGVLGSFLVVSVFYELFYSSAALHVESSDRTLAGSTFIAYRPDDYWHLAGVAAAKTIDRNPGVVVAFDYGAACKKWGGVAAIATSRQKAFSVAKLVNTSTRPLLIPYPSTSDQKTICDENTSSLPEMIEGKYILTYDNQANKLLTASGLDASFIGYATTAIEN